MSKFFGETAGRQLVREIMNMTGDALQGKADLSNGKVPAAQLPATSWNDLTNKPFNEIELYPAYHYTLPLDYKTNMIVADRKDGYTGALYRVGNAIPASSLVGATITYTKTVDGGTPTIETVTLSWDNMSTWTDSAASDSSQEFMFYSVDSTSDFNSPTFSSTGLYFGSITLDTEDGVVETTVTEISKTAIATMGADKTGLTSVEVDGSTFYRIGDAPSDYDDSYNITYSTVVDGGTPTLTTVQCDKVAVQSGLIVYSDGNRAPLCVLVLQDNTDLVGSGEGPFIDSGIYGTVVEDTDDDGNGNTTTTVYEFRSLGDQFDVEIPSDLTNATTVSVSRPTEVEALCRIGDALVADAMIGATCNNSDVISADNTQTYGPCIGSDSDSGMMISVPADNTNFEGFLFATAGLYTYLKIETENNVDTVHGIVDIQKGATTTTQRLPAKFVEADWEYMENRPFYEETIPGFEYSNPDYTSAGAVSFNVSIMGSVIPCKAVRMADAIQKTNMIGAELTIQQEADGDDESNTVEIESNRIVDVTNGYMMCSEGVPYLFCALQDNVTFTMLDGNNDQIFSVTLPTAGVFFVQLDASESFGAIIYTSALTKAATTVVHKIDSKFYDAAAPFDVTCEVDTLSPSSPATATFYKTFSEIDEAFTAGQTIMCTVALEDSGGSDPTIVGRVPLSCKIKINGTDTFCWAIDTLGISLTLNASGNGYVSITNPDTKFTVGVTSGNPSVATYAAGAIYYADLAGRTVEADLDSTITLPLKTCSSNLAVFEHTMLNTTTGDYEITHIEIDDGGTPTISTAKIGSLSPAAGVSF